MPFSIEKCSLVRQHARISGGLVLLSSLSNRGVLAHAAPIKALCDRAVAGCVYVVVRCRSYRRRMPAPDQTCRSKPRKGAAGISHGWPRPACPTVTIERQGLGNRPPPWNDREFGKFLLSVWWCPASRWRVEDSRSESHEFPFVSQREFAFRVPAVLRFCDAPESSNARKFRRDPVKFPLKRVLSAETRSHRTTSRPRQSREI